VGVLGGLGLGAGPVNGDAAVYAWQIDQGVFTERTVHLGYLLLGALLGAGTLEALTVVAAAGLCLGAGRWSGSWIAAAVVGAAVLPLASFAEVDVPWACAISWILASRTPWIAATWAAVAMSLSPMTLLALPWVLLQRPDARLVASCALTLAAITVIGSGDWWFGGRGVFNGPDLLPGRTAQSWLRYVPWLVLPLAWSPALRAHALTLTPLLLAPPDVAGWLIGALGLGKLASEEPIQRRGALLLVAAVAIGLYHRDSELRRVGAENNRIAELVATLGPDDGLESSWSVGVRASLLAGRGPYGLPWRKPGEPWRGRPPSGHIYRFDSRP